MSLFIILLTSCASQEQVRSIASSEAVVRLAEIDYGKSIVQIFPAGTKNDLLSYYLYVQLKDEKGLYVDCDPADFGIKIGKDRKVDFKVERLLTGRYYLSLEKTDGLDSKHMDLLVKGRALKEQFQLQLKVPHKGHTKLKQVSNAAHVLTLELRLADQKNAPVELPEPPEILMDGHGSLSEMRHIGEGVWQFQVNYPDENQIIYFSVRAMGVMLPNLFRFQHIEK